MEYLYSYAIDSRKHFPPRVAMHRVVRSTEQWVHVKYQISGFWTATKTVFQRTSRRPTVKILSCRTLDEQGYVSDGLRTYYATPEAVQALIDNK